MKNNLQFLTRAGTEVSTKTNAAKSEIDDVNDTITAFGVFCLKTNTHYTLYTEQKI